MDVFSLAAKLMLDSSDFEKGLTKQEGIFKKFGQKAKSIATGVAKVGTLAFGAISASFIPIVKNATAAYGEYEQLVGGVETLFKNSAKALQENADKAFQSAGLSANAYMETATSFAASLIQGLGGDTAKAAEYADRAIVDMSDNANKMGTDIEAIQNAYKGFSKQNFTMLDNLKLGYGGTKTEMERLLKDAEKLTGRKFDISNFADIVDAIHAVQESMDVAGTTAKEASTTIQGSWNATKAAWQNLLVAMADPKGNIKKATKSLVDSAKTTLKNVSPIISESISGIGEAVAEIAPLIGEKLPGLVADLTPKLFDAGRGLIEGLGKGIGKFAKTIKFPTWNDVKTFATNAWDKIKQGVSNLGGLVFGYKYGDGKGPKVNWPDWDDVEAFALEKWDTLKRKVKEFAGLVFGKKEDGSVDWPDFKDFEDKAVELWGGLKDFVGKAVNLGGKLLFGTDEKGDVDWPTKKELEDKAKELWGGLKDFVKKVGNLGGKLIFGEDEQGEVKWPTIEQVRTSAQAFWKDVGNELGDIFNFIFGVENPDDADAQASRIEKWWWDEVVPLLDKTINYTLALFGMPSVQDMADQINNWWNDVSAKTQLTFHNISTSPLRLWDSIFGTDYAVQEDYKFAVDRMIKGIKDEWDKEFWASWNKENGISENMLIPLETEPEMSDEKKAEFQEEYAKYVEDLKKSNPLAIPLTYDEFEKKKIKDMLDGLTKDRTVNINVRTNYGGGVFLPKAKGDWDVPYDNFPALLHRNEMVLTASQARKYKDGETGINRGFANAILETVSTMSASIARLEQKQTMLIMDRQKVGETMNSAVSNRQNVLLRGMGG